MDAIAIFATAAVLNRGYAQGPGLRERTLRFERDGALVREIDRAIAGRSSAVSRPIVVEADPYYEKRKHFLACPIAYAYSSSASERPADPPDQNLLLPRARRLYEAGERCHSLAESPEVGSRWQTSVRGEQKVWIHAHSRSSGIASSSGGDRRWEPLGRAAVDPGPFYLVWTGPRPGRCAPIPMALPAGRHRDRGFRDALSPQPCPAALSPRATRPARGFGIFRTECVSCHAINGEGGKVGPDLNIPRSIVEYRPAAQIKAFIRDPEVVPLHQHALPSPSFPARSGFTGGVLSGDEGSEVRSGDAAEQRDSGVETPAEMSNEH